jgi:hypothetical protein
MTWSYASMPYASCKVIVHLALKLQKLQQSWD